MSTATATENKVNGVNVDRLVETIGAIKQQPALAQFTFRNRNQWIDGDQNRSSIKDFSAGGQEDQTRSATFVFDAGEPEILLGSNKGANPVEFLLHALAACMTTSLVYHAAARGITIESVESCLEGNLDLQGFLGLDETIRPGYESIRARFKIKADAPAEALQELFKFSPVHNSVTQGVPVNASVEMV